MNEKFEKFVAEVFFDETADASDTKIYNLNDAQMQKFAELIVRECMTICAEREEDIRTRIKDEGKAATAYMIRAYIKEHFGVKE